MEVTPSEISDYDFIQDKVREAFYEPEITPSHFVEEIYAHSSKYSQTVDH